MSRRTGRSPERDWIDTLIVRELFATLLKARRAVRAYPPGHPFRELPIRELGTCAGKLLARRPVHVDVTPDRVLFDGRTVFSEPPGESLLGALAAAGIDGLDFGREATLSSLCEFVERTAEPPCATCPATARAAWGREAIAGNMPGIAAHSTCATA